MGDDEIQLISDGDGLAVIGEPDAVDRFLASEGLVSTDLGLPRLRSVLGTGAAAAQAGSEIAASSGRWVKLTAESAEQVKKFGLMDTNTPGVKHAMIGRPGAIKGWLQLADTPRSLLTNPAVLTGAAGIMAQLAMQQAMAEVTDYLAAIDAKLDDVLRAQKDATVAQMIGVGVQVDEAMRLREHVGRVSEVTWSKLHAAPGTIAATQAYALRQIDALAEKLASTGKVGALASATKAGESEVREWLGVLARCAQLQDAIAILELDRVLESAPEDLDGHRRGLEAARRARLDAIARSTEQLLDGLDAASGTANAKVLTHPSKSRAVVRESNRLGTAVSDFHGRLGIESARQPLEARRWRDAATTAKDGAVDAGAEGLRVARRVGGGARGRAKSATGRASKGIAERARRLRDDDR
ncbi:MAG TPA: hypothetical protein VIL55_04250 [Naasia sp.]|jgi:hypothetical protein